MKNTLYISVLIILISSCASESLVVKPEYTTTDAIYSLNIGMTESQVIKKLGLSPYDITYNLSEDTKVLIWKYRRPYHNILKKSKGDKSVLSSGSERYKDDLKCFAHFTNGKLVRFYTDSGKDNSQWLFNHQHKLEAITE